MRDFRKSLLIAVFAAVLPAASGCHGAGVEARTYINQKNSKQSLRLVTKKSVHAYAVQFLHGQTTKEHGTYTLTTESETTLGSFGATKDGYEFEPSKGGKWSVKLQSDGSFEDERGVWKPQTFMKLVQIEPVHSSNEGSGK